MTTQTTQQTNVPQPVKDAVKTQLEQRAKDVDKAKTGPVVGVEMPEVKLDPVMIKKGADVILQDAKRASSTFRDVFGFIQSFRNSLPADEKDATKREDYRYLVITGTLSAAEAHACTIYERSLKAEDPNAKVETLRDLAKKVGVQRLTYEQYKSRILKAYKDRFDSAKLMQEYYDWQVKNEGADQTTVSDGWLDVFGKRYAGKDAFDLFRRDMNRTDTQLAAYKAKKERAERALKKEKEQKKIDQDGAGMARSGDKTDQIPIKSAQLQAAWNLMIQTFMDAVSGPDAVVEKREDWLVAVLSDAVGTIKDKLNEEREADKKPAFSMSVEDKAAAANEYLAALPEDASELPDDPAAGELTDEDKANIEQVGAA